MSATALQPTQTAATPASHMVCLLDQLATVVAQLDDSHYRVARAREVSGSVGGHVRHCLDHVAALVRGLDNGHVDYDDGRGARPSSAGATPHSRRSRDSSSACKNLPLARRTGQSGWTLAARISRRRRSRASWPSFRATPSITWRWSLCCCTIWEFECRHALATRRALRVLGWRPDPPQCCGVDDTIAMSANHVHCLGDQAPSPPAPGQQPR